MKDQEYIKLWLSSRQRDERAINVDANFWQDEMTRYKPDYISSWTYNEKEKQEAAGDDFWQWAQQIIAHTYADTKVFDAKRMHKMSPQKRIVAEMSFDDVMGFGAVESGNE